MLPRRLDRELRGRLEASDKDVTFPPMALYNATGYSVVFESQIQVEREWPAYFTEKLFKPLRYGHPFIHDCASGSPWPVLRDWGFRDYAPLIPTHGYSLEAVGTCGDRAHRARAREIEAAIRNASAAAWADVQRRAGRNAHDFHCKLGPLLRTTAKRAWRDLTHAADALVPICGADSPLLRHRRGRALCDRVRRCAHLVPPRAGAPPIVKYAPRTVCGFGTDVMEYAGLHALALHTHRPLLVVHNASEPMRMVVEPASFYDGRLRPQRRGECRRGIVAPLECFDVEPHGAVPAVSLANDPLKSDAVVRLPRDQPILFVSHSPSAAFAPAHIRNQTLTTGYSQSSGPACGLSHAFARVSARVLREASSIVVGDGDGGRPAARGGRLVAVHIRLGDSAMARECERCVVMEDPDVRGPDRVPLRFVHERLEQLAKTLQADDRVFVASDTDAGNQLAVAVFGLRRLVVHQPKSPMHSVKMTSVEEAARLLVDFFVMAMADVLVCLGSSSVSFNAASLSGKPCE